MKIRVLSDLHLEFGYIYLPSVECDVTVLAGDINIGTDAIDFIERLATESKVIYVLGNHEFYGEKIEDVQELWGSIRIPNFYFLDNKTVIIDDVLFIGSTLWTDFEESESAMSLAQRCMSDYTQIRTSKNLDHLGSRFLVPRDTQRYFAINKEYITGQLMHSMSKKTVVVTHHAPSKKSVAAPFINDRLTPAFVSNLDSLIEKHHPTLWIHGHTHSSFDYKIGRTRVVCNPYGYRWEHSDIGFEAQKIIEL